MPIRRLNFTKRRRLTSQEVQIHLSPASQGLPRLFDVHLQLPSDLPPDGRVFVEAYRTSPPARMRFDFGSVSRLEPPPSDRRRLSAFTEDVPPPQFRVKVTDVSARRGRLLAEGRIRPVVPDEDSRKRSGILHVYHKDLEGLVWDLDFDNPGYEPTLFIDDTADAARDLAHDPRFIALVYPEVLRRTLAKILIDDRDLAEDGWGAPWMKFARGIPDVRSEEPASGAEREEWETWIAEVVKAFARQKHFQSAFAQPEGSEG